MEKITLIQDLERIINKLPISYRSEVSYLTNGTKRRSEHRVLAEAETFCDTVRSLSQVSACDTGRINAKGVSPRRGIILRIRDYDVEAIAYCEDGIQRFYLKPATGTSLDELHQAAEGALQRRYTILTEEEVKKVKKERVTDAEDMAAASKVVAEMGKRREDGEIEVVGVFAALKQNLGWNTRKATAAVGNLASSGFMKKVGETRVRNRKTAVYIVPSLKVEPVPEGEPGATVPESELAEWLRQNPELAHQIIEGIWSSKAERVEALKVEVADLTEQKQKIDRELEERRSELAQAEKETQLFLSLSERFQQQQP